MNFNFLYEKFNAYEEICCKFEYTKKSNTIYKHMSDYILKLYNYKIIETDTSDKLLWNGNYYQDIEKNYKKMRKHYLRAIRLDNNEAMFSLV